ncbi:hypothetical protein CDCA_CDCA02G0689 [Cyanidium caldarium]|uniref:Proteasome subunit beta n=1 Tax=Cyanidium caldarium TaxID=2771 RepID=A0AAV9IR88_CYACA|nr:hypothetical protein CDCA_CDCA02G0689 [Cyanidium caldarium]
MDRPLSHSSFLPPLFSSAPHPLSPPHSVPHPSAAPSVNAAERPARWSPYQDNGGTVVALAGRDYAIVAADTRFSVSFSIPTREFTKITQLTDRVVLASAGMGADRQYLHKMLHTRLAMYRHQHQRDMSLPAAAQMLSNTLYSRRFFPIYAFNVLGGIDSATGEGFVYGYDAIGSHEQLKVVCSGSGQAIVQPVLDQQFSGRQRYSVPDAERAPSLTLEQATALVRDAFASATERDIHTGDALEMWQITAAGVRQTRYELRKD